MIFIQKWKNTFYLFLSSLNNDHNTPLNWHRCVPWPHPDLQLYPLVVSVDGLHLEVDAHRAHKRWREGVVCISKQKAGLSNAAVPDDQDFEHVIKVLFGRLLLSITVICSWSHLEDAEKKRMFVRLFNNVSY